MIEGDRSALIKFIVITLFTLGLTNSSVEQISKKNHLIKNFRINKKILFQRIKIMMVLLGTFLILSFIGIARNNEWRNPLRYSLFSNIKNISNAEFRHVNYSIDFALMRNKLDIKKTDKMFTWDRIIFYPLPTYIYKSIFNDKKPPNIGSAIGIETKNYVYGSESKLKGKEMGVGLSPIAEGFINLGHFGVLFLGLIYGLAIGILQSWYNKISLDKINLIDIIVLNTLGIVPLIMRSGTAGIYNWIFSTSFVLFLPLLLIDIFKRKKFREISKFQINEYKK